MGEKCTDVTQKTDGIAQNFLDFCIFIRHSGVQK